MGQAFATWWKAQQQAAFFGAFTLVVPVTYYAADSDPETATGQTINCSIRMAGEQPMPGDFDRSLRKAVTAISKAEVPALTRGSTGYYGHVKDAAGMVYAITAIERENDALFVVSLERQEFDTIGKARGGR